MKKLLLLFASIFALTAILSSCKKNDDSDGPSNISSAAEIQKAILDGVWQMESWKEGAETSYKDAESYLAYKFTDTKKCEIYAEKNTAAFSEPYKITTMDGKAVFLTYRNDEAYDKDEYRLAYDVTIENGRLKLSQRGSNYALLLRKYKTMNDTKELPRHT